MYHLLRKFGPFVLGGGICGAFISGHFMHKQHQLAVIHNMNANLPTVKDAFLNCLCGFVSGAIVVIGAPIIVPYVALMIWLGDTSSLEHRSHGNSTDTNTHSNDVDDDDKRDNENENNEIEPYEHEDAMEYERRLKQVIKRRIERKNRTI